MSLLLSLFLCFSVSLFLSFFLFCFSLFRCLFVCFYVCFLCFFLSFCFVSVCFVVCLFVFMFVYFLICLVSVSDFALYKKDDTGIESNNHYSIKSDSFALGALDNILIFSFWLNFIYYVTNTKKYKKSYVKVKKSPLFVKHV